jgi:tetratricopeptide (TPR) repeat protein
MRLGASPPAQPTRSALRPVLLVGGAVAVALAAVSVALPWLAARDVDAAVKGWRTDPAAAFERLDRARSLNPLGDEADVFTGVIAGQLGESGRQRVAFERALERNQRNWYPYLELGVLDARRGRRMAALRQLAEARRLNPIEPVLTVVQDWLKDGRTPSRNDLDQLLISRAKHLTPGSR